MSHGFDAHVEIKPCKKPTVRIGATTGFWEKPDEASNQFQEANGARFETDLHVTSIFCLDPTEGNVAGSRGESSAQSSLPIDDKLQMDFRPANDNNRDAPTEINGSYPFRAGFNHLECESKCSHLVFLDLCINANPKLPHHAQLDNVVLANRLSAVISSCNSGGEDGGRCADVVFNMLRFPLMPADDANVVLPIKRAIGMMVPAGRGRSGGYGSPTSSRPSQSHTTTSGTASCAIELVKLKRQQHSAPLPPDIGGVFAAERNAHV